MQLKIALLLLTFAASLNVAPAAMAADCPNAPADTSAALPPGTVSLGSHPRAVTNAGQKIELKWRQPNLGKPLLTWYGECATGHFETLRHSRRADRSGRYSATVSSLFGPRGRLQLWAEMETLKTTATGGTENVKLLAKVGTITLRRTIHSTKLAPHVGIAPDYLLPAEAPLTDPATISSTVTATSTVTVQAASVLRQTAVLQRCESVRRPTGTGILCHAFRAVSGKVSVPASIFGVPVPLPGGGTTSYDRSFLPRDIAIASMQVSAEDKQLLRAMLDAGFKIRLVSRAELLNAGETQVLVKRRAQRMLTTLDLPLPGETAP